MSHKYNYYLDLLQLIESLNHTQSKENIKDHIITNAKFSSNRKIRNNATQVVNDAQVNYNFKQFCLR